MFHGLHTSPSTQIHSGGGGSHSLRTSGLHHVSYMRDGKLKHYELNSCWIGSDSDFCTNVILICYCFIIIQTFMKTISCTCIKSTNMCKSRKLPEPCVINNEVSKGFQFPKDMKFWIVVFWVVTMCSVVGSYKCFKGKYCFLLQGGAEIQYFTPKN
jgi:hypothetical protein